MCDQAGGVGRGRIGVLLAQHLRRSRVLYVVQPALYGYAVSADPKVAEGQHGSVCRWRAPDLELDFRGLAGYFEGIETFGDQVEDARVIQIIPQGIVKSFEQVAIFRVLGGGLEVGNCQSDLLDPQAGASMDPILLRETRERDQQKAH